MLGNLLHNGRTVHTTFKLPLNINNSTCNIKPNCEDGDKMRKLKIIIWEAITMTSRFAFEVVDRMLKDICNNDLHFRDNVIIISGDFRQTLPVVRHGNRVQILENYVKNSQLWKQFKSMNLKENKRIKDHDKKNGF